MLWMLKDRTYFGKVLDTLRERLIFSEEVWAYSFHHRDNLQACREYLMNTQAYQLKQNIGNCFQSKLLDITLEDSEWRHLDYYPVVNARAHTVGDLEHWTLNRNFKQTYGDFLRSMALNNSTQRQAALSPTHLMIFA